MTFKSVNNEINRLRFVNAEAVVSMDLPTNATLADVAREFDAFAPTHDYAAMTVDIIIPANGNSQPWRKMMGSVTATFFQDRYR